MEAMRLRRRLLLALPALALAGCATGLPPPRDIGDRAAALYRDSLTLSGRISVRYQQDGRDESLQGGFQWIQDAQTITLNLLSPLNQILLRIEVTPDTARLLEPGKPPRSAPNIESLMLQTFGWSLPVAGLRGWLQGFSLDSTPPTAIVTPGMADAPPVTTRDGWKLSYVSWQDEAETRVTRPRRIDLERSTPEFGEMAIRIVIDTWQSP